MRYTKYVKYIMYFILLNIILILITIFQGTEAGVFGKCINTPLISDFFYGFIMSISTGIIVYVFTAIHSEKIEFYKNENNIISIYLELQNFRNTISTMEKNIKDLDSEKALDELKVLRSYCNNILILFCLGGVENSRSGISENMCNKLLYSHSLKHVIECENIWRKIAYSVDRLLFSMNWNDDIVTDGMIMETVVRLNRFLDKYADFLSVYTTAILEARNVFPTEKKIYKTMNKESLFKNVLIHNKIDNMSLLKSKFQEMLRDSRNIAVEENEKRSFCECRTTYKYVFCNGSLYMQILERYKKKKNRKSGYILSSQYSSVKEKRTLRICINDLLVNGYISLEMYGTQEVYYITKKGREILKKYKRYKDDENKRLCIDMRTGKQIDMYPALAYDVLEYSHVKLSNS